MRNLVLLVVIVLSASAFAQKEGQNFCDANATGEYFPLDIKKKKLLWSDTFYFETIEGTKTIKGKTYTAFVQSWPKGTVDTLYIRKDGTRVIEYLKETGNETVKFDTTFKEGHTWESKGAKNTLLSYNAELTTPYCRYTGLMSIKAEYPNATYIFYYLKGYGYVGATRNGKVISGASPEW